MPQSAKSKAKARGLECNPTQTETLNTPFLLLQRNRARSLLQLYEARRKRPCESVLQNIFFVQERLKVQVSEPALYSLCLFWCERLVDKSELIMVPEKAMSRHSEKAYVNVFGPYSQSEAALTFLGLEVRAAFSHQQMDDSRHNYGLV